MSYGVQNPLHTSYDVTAATTKLSQRSHLAGQSVYVHVSIELLCLNAVQRFAEDYKAAECVPAHARPPRTGPGAAGCSQASGTVFSHTAPKTHIYTTIRMFDTSKRSETAVLWRVRFFDGPQQIFSGYILMATHFYWANIRPATLTIVSDHNQNIQVEGRMLVASIA